MDVGRDLGWRPILGVDLLELRVCRSAFGEQFGDDPPGVVAVEQRAVSRAVAEHAIQDDADGRRQAEDATGAPKSRSILGIEQQPPARSDDQPGSVSQISSDMALDGAERRFALLGEDDGDGPVVSFDQLIGVEKVKPNEVSQDAADGGFAGPHETREHDIRRR